MVDGVVQVAEDPAVWQRQPLQQAGHGWKQHHSPNTPNCAMPPRHRLFWPRARAAHPRRSQGPQNSQAREARGCVLWLRAWCYRSRMAVAVPFRPAATPEFGTASTAVRELTTRQTSSGGADPLVRAVCARSVRQKARPRHGHLQRSRSCCPRTEGSQAIERIAREEGAASHLPGCWTGEVGCAELLPFLVAGPLLGGIRVVTQYAYAAKERRREQLCIRRSQSSGSADGKRAGPCRRPARDQPPQGGNAAWFGHLYVEQDELPAVP